MARSVGRTDGRRGGPNAPEMTTGLHRQVSLKLAAIIREGASRGRLSCGTRAWAACRSSRWAVRLRRFERQLLRSLKDLSGSKGLIGSTILRDRLRPANAEVPLAEMSAGSGHSPHATLAKWRRVASCGPDAPGAFCQQEQRSLGGKECLEEHPALRGNTHPAMTPIPEESRA